jgi:hypothetical protein
LCCQTQITFHSPLPSTRRCAAVCAWLWPGWPYGVVGSGPSLVTPLTYDPGSLPLGGVDVMRVRWSNLTTSDVILSLLWATVASHSQRRLTPLTPHHPHLPRRGHSHTQLSHLCRSGAKDAASAADPGQHMPSTLCDVDLVRYCCPHLPSSSTTRSAPHLASRAVTSRVRMCPVATAASLTI